MKINRMKFRIEALVILLLLGPIQILAETDGELSLKDSLLQLKTIPLMDIHTVDGEEPTCDYIDKNHRPPGTIGEGITNCTKVPCRCIIYKGGGAIYDSGDYEPGESGLTIKIRGNTSALYS